MHGSSKICIVGTVVLAVTAGAEAQADESRCASRSCAAGAAPLVFVGESPNGRVHVRLVASARKSRATIRLGGAAARRSAERQVMLRCGVGRYEREALVELRWPAGKRRMTVGTDRAITTVDRCRVRRPGRTIGSMSMTIAAA